MTADDILAIASGEIGVRELGRNRGPRVEEYQRENGGEPGEPWCSDWVCWVLRRAHATFKPSRSALHLWRNNPDAQRAEPLAGRVFVVDHGGGEGHVGFVEQVTAGGLVTIEGNTDGSGTREGDGVYRRLRGYGPTIIGYLHFAGIGTEDVTPGAVPTDLA